MYYYYQLISFQLHVLLLAFECSAVGTLEKVEGQLKFTKIVVTPKVHVPSEREKKHALHALKLVDKHCLVTNSMNVVVEMHPEVIMG